MKELEFGEEMMVEMSEIGISKDVWIKYDLFMGDLGGGPIIDGPIGPKDLSTSFIFYISDVVSIFLVHLLTFDSSCRVLNTMSRMSSAVSRS